MAEKGYSSTILDFCTRWRLVVSFTPRSLYLRGNSPRYPLYREAGWTPEPVWTTRTRTPTRPLNRPASSQSLYRLRVQAMQLYSQEKSPDTYWIGGWVGSSVVWTLWSGEISLTPAWNRTPTPPLFSPQLKSLHRLTYPGRTVDF
jgi:hypothetical protein